ncbi:unnamed protein product [Dibothriocephalus latus]|uniref:BAH domain-containing protein n=1 Tax=Dibothriocephalus latus TaxID=60516 RepID=A0A3P7MWU5_DIBLA|nr:unnamed protein product [Dibothriocephalus latus]
MSSVSLSPADFVFFEASASAPFQIRKIEELNKTSSGAVEAKVVCFYRRQDLASSLVQLADAHQQELLKNLKEHASPEQVHQLKHRELFLSRHLEVLPATHIRGKCHVTLRSETEPCMSYLQKEDAFFFQLVYDPVNKTLQADRGAIRVGEEYQAVVPERISKFFSDQLCFCQIHFRLCSISGHFLFVHEIHELLN